MGFLLLGAAKPSLSPLVPLIPGLTAGSASKKSCLFGLQSWWWQTFWIILKKMHFCAPTTDENWFADQLIGSVGLCARAVSRKTPTYLLYDNFMGGNTFDLCGMLWLDQARFWSWIFRLIAGQSQRHQNISCFLLQKAFFFRTGRCYTILNRASKTLKMR